MNIDRNNYEAYLIDYLDGKLNPVESAELFQFLSQNPDIEAEFGDFESIKLSNIPVPGLDKNKLKKDFSDIKTINNKNFNEFCVASYEGDLSEHDKLKLEEYLKNHPEKQKDFELYSYSYLTPDYSIKFPQKGNIKKISPFIRPRNMLIYVTSLAAAVLLLIMLVFVPGKRDKMISGLQVTEDVKEVTTISRDKYGKGGMPRKDGMNGKAAEVTGQHIAAKKNKGFEPQEIIIADKKATPEYLTPIYVSKISSGKISDIKIIASINASQMSYESKYEPDKLTIRNLVNIDDPEDSWIMLDRINLWKVAEAGIKSFNYLTESQVLISKKLSDEGKIVAFGLDSESFRFSSSRSK
jgi:hypothetical protein